MSRCGPFPRVHHPRAETSPMSEDPQFRARMENLREMLNRFWAQGMCHWPESLLRCAVARGD